MARAVHARPDTYSGVAGGGLAGCRRSDPAAQVPVPPDGLETFVNTREGLPRHLLDHYVDFSFQYPRSWTINHGVRYIQVERGLTDAKLGDSAVESFNVGAFWLWGDKARPENVAKSLAEAAREMSDQYAKHLPAWKKVSEGPALVAGVQGYDFHYRFRRGEPEVPWFGRTIILPHLAGEGDGLLITMWASSRLPEVWTADHVGVKGELPIVLNSLRVRK